MVRAAMRRLSETPDFTMIQIDSATERVKIDKKGKHLVIDVVDEEETVHLSVPISVVTSIMRRLESVQRDEPSMRISVSHAV